LEGYLNIVVFLNSMGIKRCPKCRSTNVDFYAGGLTGSYHCKVCGYIGPILLEEEDIENKRKK
jgi:hypothetical protein